MSDLHLVERCDRCGRSTTDYEVRPYGYDSACGYDDTVILCAECADPRPQGTLLVLDAKALNPRDEGIIPAILSVSLALFRFPERIEIERVRLMESSNV